MENDHKQRIEIVPENPPSYESHDPQNLYLPSVPTTDLRPIESEQRSPLIASSFQETTPRAIEPEEPKAQPTVWPSANPLAAYYSTQNDSPKAKPTMRMESPMDMDLTSPDSRDRRGGSVVSMDDPDVRIAAEALGDLRAADFIQSPPHKHTTLPSPHRQSYATNRHQPEPLLSLLTTSHPLLGTAIGGSLSAYSASKNYSPRFKSSAEYVERGLTPVVNTVGSVGRVTGVEGGVRWFLGGRRPSHNAPSDADSGKQGSNKRRKIRDDEMDIDRNISDPYPVYRQEMLHHRERRPSQASTVESLPAYDDHRSPSYEAEMDGQLVLHKGPGSPLSPGSSWQSRLIMSTSGLSISMSEESLRSLRYCLGWLRWANEHIGKVIEALKSVLEEYDNASAVRANGLAELGDMSGLSEMAAAREQAADRTVLSRRIAELKSDVLKTLRDVVDVVSKYAGGALPENARLLVRRHLTSLPQRFKIANTAPNTPKLDGVLDRDTEVRDSAARVLVLAKEGLDMMTQVSGVVDGTIVSAEEWCERLGRKKRADLDTEEEDLKMRLPNVPAGPLEIRGSQIQHSVRVAEEAQLA